MDFGGTDATNFSKAGLKAATIIGLGADFWRFWHSLKDTPGIIEVDKLQTCAEMGIWFIEDFWTRNCALRTDKELGNLARKTAK